ncbi:MAG TPA: hypothetical protein VNA68_03520 [Candidatus Dormibacteraeota bacterium]|nr:hypothetical protein [Candidatus Dormibacteraeota bacterium]
MPIKLKISGNINMPEQEISLRQAGRIIEFLGAPEENAVGGQLSSSKKPKPRSRSKKASASTPSVQVRDELSKITYSPDLDGYPNYHALPTKGAKVMWVLAFAAANAIVSLRPNEISYAAFRLRDKIAGSDINGLTANAAKKGWVVKDSTGSYSLLFKGDKYLKDLLDETSVN